MGGKAESITGGSGDDGGGGGGGGKAGGDGGGGGDGGDSEQTTRLGGRDHPDVTLIAVWRRLTRVFG